MSALKKNQTNKPCKKTTNPKTNQQTTKETPPHPQNKAKQIHGKAELTYYQLFCIHTYKLCFLIPMEVHLLNEMVNVACYIKYTFLYV